MKKIILSVAVLACTVGAAMAQAGSVLSFGNLGYSSVRNPNDDVERNFNFRKGLGYQFDHNWTVGAVGGFHTHRSRLNTARDWNYVNTYDFGGFIRHTVPLNKYFVFFSQVEAGYLGGHLGTTAFNTRFNQFNGFYATWTPAIGVMVHDGFALNFSYGGLDFRTQKFAGLSTKPKQNFDFTFGNQFNIGVSKNFLCGSKHRRHHKHHRGERMNYGSKKMHNKSVEDTQEDD